MNFLTLHDLARQFNKPERVIRYKFHSLCQSGNLIENEDFRREDFVDELHFAYKINPLPAARNRASPAPSHTTEPYV